MSIVKRNIGAFPAVRTLLSDFFDNENLKMDDFFRRDWMPAVNVSETDKLYEIELAAPGFRKEDFHIKVQDGVLTISSEKKAETETKEKNYTRKEFTYSSFSRSFTLPEDAKEEEIKANYENGVLKLMVAKTAVKETKAKEIAVF